MDIDVRERVVLITGASSGLGLAMAEQLARAGAWIGLNHYHAPEAAAAIVARIEAAGGRALALDADVRSEAEVEAMFERLCAGYGRLDVLINNAGIQQDAPFLEMSLDDWQRVIATDLSGQFLCARAAARRFVAQGIDPERSPAAGKIICISSVHDRIPWRGHVNYTAAKGGVRMMMQTLAQELAPHKIRVNAIAPGAIRTPINRQVWETPEALAALLTKIPYGRIGEPEDVAQAALWLASDASDYVTGTTLYVDGGMMLYPGFQQGG